MARYIVVACLLSCCEGDGERSPGTEAGTVRAEVVIEPADLATDMEAQAVRIVVSPVGTPVRSQSLQSVVSGIEVVGPDNRGEDVRVVVVVDNSVGREDGGVMNAELPSIVEVGPPAVGWAPGWHTLRVRDVPSELRFAASLMTVAGDAVSRFRPDSSPTLQYIDFCQKTTTAPMVATVHFSEAVEGDSVARGFGIVFGSEACSAAAPQAVPLTAVEFQCDVRITQETRLRVSMRGVASASGAAVSVFEGADEFDRDYLFSDLPQSQPECRYLHF